MARSANRIEAPTSIAITPWRGYVC